MRQRYMAALIAIENKLLKYSKPNNYAFFAELESAGQVALPSEYGEPYIITKRMIEDGRDQLVLRDTLDIPFPTRFLQGTADEDVDVSVALRLLSHANGADMRLTLVDGADHRFSDNACLDLIERSVEDVLNLAENSL